MKEQSTSSFTSKRLPLHLLLFLLLTATHLFLTPALSQSRSAKRRAAAAAHENHVPAPVNTDSHEHLKSRTRNHEAGSQSFHSVHGGTPFPLRLPESFDFDVVLPELESNEKPKLGLHLSDDLHVQGFDSIESGSSPWIHTAGGVDVGDRLIRIDGETIDTLSAAAKRIKKAKILTFRPKEEEREEENRENLGPKTFKEVQAETKFGHVDIIEGHRVLLSIPVTPADFSSKPKSCSPLHIVYADPPQSCGTRKDGNYDDYKGAVIIAVRGGCSFALKGLLAQQNSAKGMIIVNSDNTRTFMPTDPNVLAEKASLKIPVVSISSSDAKEVEAVFKSSRDGGSARVSARLAITAQCLKDDEAFHSEYSEEHEVMMKEQVKRHREHVSLIRAQVGHKGIRRMEEDNVEVKDEDEEDDEVPRALKSLEECWRKRDDEKVMGGEMKIMLEKEEGKEVVDVEVEFVAAARSGGYIVKSSEELTITVVNDEIAGFDCEKQPRGKHVFSNAVVFKSNRCSRFEQLKIAQLLRAEIVMLWDSGNGNDMADILIPEFDYQVGYEYRREDEVRFGHEIGLKVGIVMISFASKERIVGLERRLTVDFVADNNVALAWTDLRHLANPKEWPHDVKQRKRLLSKLLKLHEVKRWPDRVMAIRMCWREADVWWRHWDAEHGRRGEGDEDKDGFIEYERRLIERKREGKKRGSDVELKWRGNGRKSEL